MAHRTPAPTLASLDGDDATRHGPVATEAAPDGVSTRQRSPRPRRHTGDRAERRAGVPAPTGAAVSATRRASWRSRPVSSAVLIVFSRQLSSFLEAGIPVIEALEIVGTETTSEHMRAVVAEMRDTVLRGGSFANAVDAHPAVFPGWYRAMVRSAEFTGRLDVVLEQLAQYLDRDQQARRQVKGALAYPTFVLIVALAAMVVMSLFVLPKFTAMYAKLDADLPWPTRILLGWTDLVGAVWPFVLGGLALLAVVIAVWFGPEGRGKRRRDHVVMRTPVVGRIYHMICVERFSRVLAALTSAGVPLPDGIEMSARSTNNAIFLDRMATVREALLRGEGIVDPLKATGLLPTSALQMVRVGERTGKLPEQLTKAAAFFEREVGHRIRRATGIFQPTVIVVVGLLIGFIAIAQVAAMYSIFGQVNQ